MCSIKNTDRNEKKNKFKLTQFISGHRPTKSYLGKFKLNNSNTCKCYYHLVYDSTLLNGPRTNSVNTFYYKM